jgi:hypothetical protein
VAIFTSANASTVLQQAGLGRLEVLTSLPLPAAMSFLSLQQVAFFTSANASTVLLQAGLGWLEVVLPALLLPAALSLLRTEGSCRVLCL